MRVGLPKLFREKNQNNTGERSTPTAITSAFIFVIIIIILFVQVNLETSK